MADLSLRNVGHTYPGDYPIRALSDVTLDIKQGEYVALVGPSGSGKSTLLNILGLLDKPSAGHYLIDDIDTAVLTEQKASLLRAQTFGIIFQAFHLMDRRSALENTEMGTLYHGLGLPVRRQLARRALSFVGLANAAEQRVSTLSGGQRQRVAIARAVTTAAPVILADEPTGNLDSRSGLEVIRTLERLNEGGATLIVVTHANELAARAGRVLQLQDGRIIRDVRNSVSPAGQGTGYCGWGDEYADYVGNVFVRRGVEPARSGEWAGKHYGAYSLAGDAAKGDSRAPSLPESAIEPRSVAPKNGVDSRPQRRYSHVGVRDMLADIMCGLRAHMGRAAGLAAAIALAVAFALTTAGVALTARYQVSDVFDATVNKRVTIATQQRGDQAATRRLIALARQPQGLARVRKLAGVDSAAAYLYRPDASVSAHLGHTEQISLISLVDAHHPTVRLDVPGYDSSRPLRADEALVGETAARRLGLGPVAAVPTITINGTPRTVVGIVKSAGLRAEILSAVLVPDADADRYGAATWAGLEIRTAPGAAKQVARQAPIAWMPPVRRGLNVNAPPDPQNMRAKIEGSVTAILVTLTLVAVIGAVIALGAAMMSTTRQRYHEFGLRRTIGARRRHIAGIIIIETAILSLCGGVAGTALSVLVTLIAAIARGWQPVIEPLLLPGGIVLALVVGLLGSLGGAWKASRISPAAALQM